MKKTAKGPLDDFRPLDDHVLHGHVGVTAAFSGLGLLYSVDHVLAFDDFAEHAVPPALGAGRRVVEEVVVLDVMKNWLEAECGSEVRAMATV